MSCSYIPDKELFESGVLIKYEYNDELKYQLQGLCWITEADKSDNVHSIPCIYKKILSYKNGFARAINPAGNLVYIGEDGDVIYDRELPFVIELCEDFDENGKAKIACLVDGVFIVRGYMNQHGDMFLKNYNS